MVNVLKNKNLMQASQVSLSAIARLLSLFAVAAFLTLFANRAAAQDTGDQSQQPDQQQQPQDNPPPRRVISRDNVPQDQAAPEEQDQDQGPQQAPPPPRRYRRDYGPQAPTGPLPPELVIPAGNVISIRTNEVLSSDRNKEGDTFTSTLAQPIVVNGWVVARRGETVVGTVTNAKKAGRVKGTSQLGLTLAYVTTADGQQLAVNSELWKGSGGTTHGADAGTIVGTTGVGSIIGAVADGGAGAGIGAGAGAAAGIATVLLTRGRPTILAPETLLSFRLKEPLTVSTKESAQAFHPVGPNDYGPSPSLRARGGLPYPPPPYPYYAACGPYGCGPYAYPYYGYYGPGFVGIYGGYWGGGWGRGFGHGGFRR